MINSMFSYFSGYFPFHPNICVVWATTDVLMCTASIWHMCTMSMDRYFTLKYPMKYGRNKTKKMVVLKILFVWIVSFAICTPLCIMGFTDHSNVFNQGICAPAIKSFVIYGSIFAFYIPLTIMLITYVLTLNILCNNNKLINNISKQDKLLRMHRGGHTISYNNSLPMNSFCRSKEESVERPSHISEYSPTKEENIPITIVQSTPNQSESRTKEGEDKRASNTDSAMTASIRTSSLQSSSLKMSSYNNLSTLPIGISPAYSQRSLQLPRDANSSRRCSNLSLNYDYKSFYSLTSLNSALSRMHLGSGTFDSSFENIDILEKMSLIEQEMDECLQESDNPSMCSDPAKSKPDCQEHDNDNNNVNNEDNNEQEETCLINVPTQANNDLYNVESHTPESEEEEEEEAMASEHSGLITVNIKPNGMYMYHLDGYRKRSSDAGMPSTDRDAEVAIPSSNQQSSDTSQDASQDNLQILNTDNANGNINSNGCSITVSPSIYSPESTEESLDTDVQNSFLSTSTCGRSYLIKNGNFAKYSPNDYTSKNSNQWKNILELNRKKIIHKRTANNERKASKVLGIIFLVFAVLWTPFFVINVLSVTCEVCFNRISTATMATIVWLGYMSSLANPIIYTMFNTAFRRAFIKILTCKCSRGHPLASFPDSHYVTSNWINDRRATLTLTLREY